MTYTELFRDDAFAGQSVLVTGGRSGIGYAIAERFLKLGATVTIASRNESLLQEAQSALSALGKCHALACDIREPAQVDTLLDSVDSNVGSLDIVINNAGGQFPSAAENISPNGWRAVINNNLNGTFFVTQAAAKRFMIPGRRGGVFVNIIANMFRGFPGMAHTGAARAGVENLAMTLAVEWSTHNIRINSVAPGVIESSGLSQYPPHLLKETAGKIPMKRFGTTHEVADATLFLASPLARYVTGETLYVDGGQRLWGDMWMVPDRKENQ